MRETEPLYVGNLLCKGKGLLLIYLIIDDEVFDISSAFNMNLLRGRPYFVVIVQKKPSLRGAFILN